MRDILVAIGAMAMSFLIGLVALTIAAIITLTFVAVAYGRIERDGVIVHQFDYVACNDVYENEKHSIRQFVALRDRWGAEPKIEAVVVTRLDAFVIRRGEYFNLIWTDDFGQVHLWRFKSFERMTTDDFDLLQVYTRTADCQTYFTFDWECGNGPTPARK